MIIRSIAIDDEYPALRQLQEFSAKIPFLEVMAVFQSALKALEFLKNENVDLIFLDIEMKGLDGLQFLSVLKLKPLIIITSAHRQYACDAYDKEVFDYLLKPISFARFVRAADRAFDQMRLKQTVNNSTAQDYPLYRLDYIFVKTEYSMTRIDLNGISYIEGLKEYVSIFTDQNKRIVSLQSMKKLEQNLPEKLFARIHRSYIVSLAKITSVERNRLFVGDKSLPISESYKKYFFEKIGRNII